MKTKPVSLSYRLGPAATERAQSVKLSPGEANTLAVAAKAAELPVGTYIREVLARLFGENETLASLQGHAREMSLPVAELVRILLLASAGAGEDETLREYKILARRAGRELREGES